MSRLCKKNWELVFTHPYGPLTFFVGPVPAERYDLVRLVFRHSMSNMEDLVLRLRETK